MTTTTRGRTVPALTQLVLTGTPAEVRLLTNAAARSGRLILATTPTAMPGQDPRIRVVVYLTPAQ